MFDQKPMSESGTGSGPAAPNGPSPGGILRRVGLALLIADTVFALFVTIVIAAAYDLADVVLVGLLLIVPAAIGWGAVAFYRSRTPEIRRTPLPVLLFRTVLGAFLAYIVPIGGVLILSLIVGAQDDYYAEYGRAFVIMGILLVITIAALVSRRLKR